MTSVAHTTPICRLAGLAGAAIAVLLTAACLQAADPPTKTFSYSGNFVSDDDKREFFFTLATPGTVRLRTLSYAGGIDVNGAAVPGGGFDPTLSLFDGSGLMIAVNRDGGCGLVGKDPVTSSCWDAFLSASLPAGNYRLVLTQSDNAPAGPDLASSFLLDGQGNFTQAPGGAAPGFWDYYPDKRTNFYALEIQGVTVAQTPAIISPATPPAGTPGQLYTPFTLTAQGGTGTPFTWTAGPGIPPGLTLSTAGVLQGTPLAKGIFSFVATATDGVQTLQQTVTISIFDPLSITTSVLPQGTSLQPYGPVTLVAVGGSGSYTWNSTTAPSGLTVSSAGQVAGTPAIAGVYTGFAILVKDTVTGQTASANLSLTVVEQSTPLLLITGPGRLPGIALGDSVNAVFSVSGGKSPFTWSGTNLPNGLSMNAATGALTGKPAAAGNYNFVVQVTDSQTNTAALAVSLSVLGITTSALPTANTADPYSATLAVAGGTAPYLFSATGLPSGLTLSTAGVLSGTAALTGSYPITITVRDAAGVSASVNLALSVTAITPGQPDLILSQTVVSFAIPVAETASVPVRSSAVEQILNYSVASSVPWLDVTPTGTTPGAIGIALNAAGLALPAQATPYTSVVTVTCTAPSPCAGHAQIIQVALNVSAQPARLGVSTNLLSFLSTDNRAQAFDIQNKGSETLTIASATAADPWLRVGPLPATVASGSSVPITITADPTGLAPGYYRGAVTVVSSAGSETLYAGLLVSNVASLSLSPGAMQFQMPAGGVPGITDGSFSIAVAGIGSIAWAAAPIDTPWLSVITGSGTASAASPGKVNFTLDAAAAALLAPGIYYGTVRVTSNGVVNSPTDFRVILTVTAASDPVKPELSTGGLVFVLSAPGALPAQTVQIFASSAAPVPYQASVSSNAKGWLSVSPALGASSAAAPGLSSITVNPADLKPGVYRAGISYAFSSDAVRTVNVTLLVVAPRSSTAPACAPTQLIPAQIGLASNFAQPAALATPLSVRVIDDCGAPAPAAHVSMAFSNGDAPLNLSPVDTTSGLFSALWTPSAVSPQTTLTATAGGTGLLPSSTQITGEVVGGPSPALAQNGTTSIYNPLIGGSIAPGAIVQIYGAQLAAEQASSTPGPLPLSLGGVSVQIGGMAAPVYYVSPGQINAQAPFALVPGRAYEVVVNRGGALTSPASIVVSPVAPGIAAYPNGSAIAQHSDFTLVTPESPARPSETVMIYLAGLGATDIPVATGALSPADPFARPSAAASITVGGLSAPIPFIGLAPGLVGLYQLNFTVPGTAPDGNLPLVFTQVGATANATSLPVRSPSGK